MNKRLPCAALALTLLANAVAAIAADDPTTATAQTLANAAKQGIPLTVNSTVGDSASVEAVLIPADIAKHIFGAETAKHYMVIELIVANHNPQASLILESVFLDYKGWPLASSPNPFYSTLNVAADSSGTAATSSSSPTDYGKCLNGVSSTPNISASQRLNCREEVGSAEYRVVRAELLDRQPYTKRNLVINGAVALGSVATAFAFPFSTDVVRGFNAWNGGLVPAASALFPDGTVAQLNHISDLGFQTNKLIPKQSSDIVVAFFPISRFLTKSLADIYRNDPAIFFIRGQIPLEGKHSKKLAQLLKVAVPDFDPRDFAAVYSINCDDQTKPKNFDGTPADLSAKVNKTQLNVTSACQIQNLIRSITLANFQVGIGGDMSVSTQVVPPTITEVDLFDSSASRTAITPATLANGPTPITATGWITGSYLTGGTPVVVDNQGNPIPNITVSATSGATDSKLPITVKISACIKAATEVYFKVTKQTSVADAATSGSSGAQSSSSVSSMLYDYGKVISTSPACP